jgi:hypothetical protein
MSNIVDFYSKYIGFENYIEFRMFDLRKKVNGRNPMRSVYCKSMEEVFEVIKKYDNENWIVYVGCNPRNIKRGVDGAVKYRRTFFFDIEMDGDKPPLSNQEYKNKLLLTAKYIWGKLVDMGIKPNLLMESGRGIHLGVKICPMLNSTYDSRFIPWIKDLIKDFMKDRPYPEIKFDDAMHNASRIESAPAFSHNKYPERPVRKILKLFLKENNIYPFINRKKFVELKRKEYFPNYRKKYTDITFYQSPEWLLLANNPDLPEGEIHNKLLLIIKIMARDHNLDRDKLQMELMKLGYNEVVDTPSPEYQYNPWTIFNWAMKHAEYCLKRKIILPFPFENPRYIVKEYDNSKCPYKNPPIIQLNTFAQVMTYIREFNRVSAHREGEKIVVFYDLMWSCIRKCLGEEQKYLYEYIEFLKIKDFISGEFTFLDNEL